jgi:hypothetical protein
VPLFLNSCAAVYFLCSSHPTKMITGATKHAAASRSFIARIVDVRKSCKLSMLAYQELHTVVAALPGHIGAYDGAYLCTPSMSCKDAQAFMMLRRPPHRHMAGKELVVSFRGTLNRQDLMDAIDIRHADFRYGKAGGRVHRGFLEQFESIEPLITRDIAYAVRKREITRVCFTGHSMGAALALLAARRYGNSDDRANILGDATITCHAFGVPPFADVMFWHGFLYDVDDHVAVNLHNDVVPVIPVHPRFSSSPPNTLEITTDGIACCILDTQKSSTPSRLVRRAARCGSMTAIVANHEASTYLTSLDRFMDRIQQQSFFKK